MEERRWPTRRPRPARRPKPPAAIETFKDLTVISAFLVLPPLIWTAVTKPAAAMKAVWFLAWPTVVGFVTTVLLASLTFWDSHIPGVDPPSPGIGPGHRLSSVYLFHGLFGAAAFVYAVIMENLD
jgi:hypothetical protein